jgi:hypothetical protein
MTGSDQIGNIGVVIAFSGGLTVITVGQWLALRMRTERAAGGCWHIH